ncbi:MAG: hypothetical protein DCC51_00870 [Anaerolineae bacterium]|nr:MAG: hypothetical protein DCC51_00870 [Anaerolineae bacterium]
MTEALMNLIPAHQFSIEELTNAYNRTRTDYLIPMPMNPGRLQEYITLYDVDLQASQVAIVDDTIVGLGMLGVRKGMGWITRLGVLPEGRRKMVGSAILQALLDGATAKKLPDVWLEVIFGNHPAHELFRKFGFKETRELIVARRPPQTMRNLSAIRDVSKVRYLQHDEVIELHCKRQERMNWLNDAESMRNVRLLANNPFLEESEPFPQHEATRLSGMSVEFLDGSLGWISYQVTTLQLKRISIEVNRGNPQRVTEGILELLHRLHSSQDAVIENIPDDERWTGFKNAGYFEVFRRIEMVHRAA